MLKADQLSVRIGPHVLLDNLSVEFSPGELVMVVGPNGAGKTTLLRCLDGELVPTEGGVEFAHKPISEWPQNDLARKRAVLPQHSTLDFPFTVNDVVLMGRMPHRTSDAENRMIVTRMLELCDCAQLSERSYTSLSGGEQQRVQTARVLAQIWDPQISPDRFLLLDEPASALDLSHQYALLRLLRYLSSKEKVGVVCTLHNLNLVAQFADRAIVIDQGMLVADGPPIDVFTEETLSNVFNLDVSVQPHPENDSIPLIIPKLSQISLHKDWPDDYWPNSKET